MNIHYIIVVLVIGIILLVENILSNYIYYKKSEHLRHSFNIWLRNYKHNKSSDIRPNNAVFKTLFHRCFPYKGNPVIELQDPNDAGISEGSVDIINRFPFYIKPQFSVEIGVNDVVGYECKSVDNIYDKCKEDFHNSYNLFILINKIPEYIIQIIIKSILKDDKQIKVILSIKKYIIKLFDAVIILVLLLSAFI